MVKLLVLSLLLMLSQSVFADKPHGKRQYQDEEMTLDGAVSQARRQYNGRVISAETEGSGTHNVRILTEDGRVRRLRYDARTGDPVRQPYRR